MGIHTIIFLICHIMIVKFALEKVDVDIDVNDQESAILLKEMRIVRCIEEIKIIIKLVT